MIIRLQFLLIITLSLLLLGCSQGHESRKGTNLTAQDILGNPDYRAFSYGGYRQSTREVVPTIEELKEDMKLLSAMGVKLLRTYNTQQYDHSAHLLEAIKQLKDEDADFEMYVMLGAWIECQGAWSASINHSEGNVENNTAEIEAAIAMSQRYPDIVKIISVGNEAMVQWAASYYVQPYVVLKWVDYLKASRDKGVIPAGTWITSSDNFASWGGGAKNYQTADLAALVKSVDYISLHTYPFHDSHYNPTFWIVPEEQEALTKLDQIDAAMLRAKHYAMSQHQGVVDYLNSLEITKPIHIGETGWASIAASNYGDTGSRAADEYKSKLYYKHMRDWTDSMGMSCFYFEAFDERWKDADNASGSENHFGLINLNGEVKYALWDMMDSGVFDGLTRNGKALSKTYDGNENKLLADILTPPSQSEMGLFEIATVNEARTIGEPVTESNYVLVHNLLTADDNNCYPSAKLKLNAWEGTCAIKMTKDGVVEVTTGAGDWWGCALEMVDGQGENLSDFQTGQIHFEIKGTTQSSFAIGFQTGAFAAGTQINNSVTFGTSARYQLSTDWKLYSIPLSVLNQGANMKDVTAPLFLLGDKDFDGKEIQIKNVYFSK